MKGRPLVQVIEPVSFLPGADLSQQELMASFDGKLGLGQKEASQLRTHPFVFLFMEEGMPAAPRPELGQNPRPEFHLLAVVGNRRLALDLAEHFQF